MPAAPAVANNFFWGWSRNEGILFFRPCWVAAWLWLLRIVAFSPAMNTLAERARLTATNCYRWRQDGYPVEPIDSSNLQTHGLIFWERIRTVVTTSGDGTHGRRLSRSQSRMLVKLVNGATWWSWLRQPQGSRVALAGPPGHCDQSFKQNCPHQMPPSPAIHRLPSADPGSSGFFFRTASGEPAEKSY